MSSCYVDFPVDSVTQGGSTYSGIEWEITPALECLEDDCYIDFVVADEANSEGLTITHYPDLYNNILALSAVGASVGQHTLSIYYEAYDDNGYGSDQCNELPVYVEAGGHIKMMKSSSSAVAKILVSTPQR
jgi:hypothetical protein